MFLYDLLKPGHQFSNRIFLQFVSQSDFHIVDAHFYELVCFFVCTHKYSLTIKPECDWCKFNNHSHEKWDTPYLQKGFFGLWNQECIQGNKKKLFANKAWNSFVNLFRNTPIMMERTPSKTVFGVLIAWEDHRQLHTYNVIHQSLNQGSCSVVLYIFRYLNFTFMSLMLF